MTTEQQEKREEAWETGYRAAQLAQLHALLRSMGYEDPALRMTTESKHPVPTGLLARYVSLGDEGYVLWCGPKETAELMREVEAIANKNEHLENLVFLLRAKLKSAAALADAVEVFLADDSRWREMKNAYCDYRAAFPKEEQP